MKYYKSNNFLKSLTTTGFTTIMSCVLIAVGAIAWFALSRNNSVSEKPNSDNSNSSYTEPESSYNISINETPTESISDVNESVKDIPYEAEETEPKPADETVSDNPIKFILPIEGKIIKNYSDSALQYSVTLGDMRLHTGIDIECETGSKIKSAGSGTVKSIIDDANYGKTVVIDHTSELSVKYCGFKEISVKEGDNINTGDILGTTGEIPCECADKPHIHIEASMQGKPTSPLNALGLE